MENQITIESPNATFHAYISRPAKLPAPVVVVLQELFGVNADIRATCNELTPRGSSRSRRTYSGGKSLA
jgi:carboxymethylenebutenolidase